MMKNHKIPIFFFLSFFLVILLTLQPYITAYASEAGLGNVSSDAYFDLPGWNMTNVIAHIEFFSSLGTRATGYPGNVIAASYIYNKFKEYGLVNVTYENFTLTNVVSEGPNTITVAGMEYPIHPGEPNFVAPSTTPPEGISGTLIYGGDGYLSSLENQPVKGSIVILDWDTELRWIDIAMLGAKAVIFVPPMKLESSYGDRFTKLLYRVPLQFPRFYVEEDVKTVLLQHLGENVTIKARQVWKQLNATNVVGFIPGTDPNEFTMVLLSSYYDSYSDFPTIAPGAQESCGIAALLELARTLRLNPPKYTIVVAAYGAHHQAIEGAVHFANEYIYPSPNLTKREIGKHLLLNFNLDLSTGTNATYLATLAGDVPAGRQYGYDPDETRYGYVGRFFKTLNSEMGRPSDMYRQTAGLPYYAPTGPYPSELAYTFPTTETQYDQAPYACSLTPPYGFTLTTAYDNRPYMKTPFDTIEKVNYQNLETQLKFIYKGINSALRLEKIVHTFFPTIEVNWGTPNFIGGYRYIAESATEISSRWNSVKGITAVWDAQKAFYTPLPNVLVSLEFYDVAAHYSRYYWNRRFTFSDQNGNFSFIGGVWGTYWSGRGRYVLTAWVVNETDGSIRYAPDLGTHRYASQYVSVGKYRTEMGDVGFLVLFEASTIVFKVASPQTLSISRTEAGPGVPSMVLQPQVSVFKSTTHVTPESWGSWSQPLDGSSLNFPHALVTVAVPPDMPIEIAVKEPGGRYPIILMTNSTEDNMIGGYTLKRGQQLLVENPYLEYARNFYWINRYRVATYLAGDPVALRLLNNTWTSLKAAEDALNAMQYAEAHASAARAWFDGYKLNLSVRLKVEDSASAVPFIALLLVPFVLLFDRLMFGQGGIKRVITSIGSFAAIVVILYILHPGFSVAASPLMIVMGFSVLILSAPIVAIIITKVFAFMRTLRIKALGKHEEAVGRGAQILYSSSVAIQNMRRRKLRSSLSLITVIIMVASLVAFTSIEAITVHQITPFPGGAPTYTGVYVHRLKWGGGNIDLGSDFVQYVNTTYGDKAVVAPRAWKYTLYRDLLGALDRSYPIGFRMTRGDKWTHAPDLLGLTPQEVQITGVDSLLLGGRWFLPGETNVCIINEAQAGYLEINETELPVSIMFENMPFSVIGIMQDEFSFVKDLDGEYITPVKMAWIPQEPNPYDQHDTMEYVLILPYETVISLGGEIASVSMKFTDNDEAILSAQDLSSMFSAFPVFLSVNNNVYQLGIRSQATIHGFTTQILPLGIVFASIFNIMVGSVHERRKEISIYSSIGLSPLSVALLFLVEAAVIAFVGSLLGYVLGIAQLRLSDIFLPGAIYTNFSSNIVFISIGISIILTLFSSLYPMMLAAKLVTPSLERVWRPPTSPVGDLWEVPLPFGTSSEEEAKGMLAYLHEFLRTHEGADAPIFSVSNIKSATKPDLSITMDMRLAPYEGGISQSVKILLPAKEGRWSFNIVMARRSGVREDWERLNHGFLSDLRKQLLLWRVLSENEKKRYIMQLKSTNEK